MIQTIGRYRVEAKIGQGGMGVVYKALDPVLERVVALKVLNGLSEDGVEARQRLLREARAAGQLTHRNIIVIHDLGEEDGQPYLAMEYLTGQNLDARIRSGPLSIEEAADLAIQLCQGLEYAHRRGIVHRDIKPGNLFLTETGELKILDFGLVHVVASSLTRTRSVLGTANYMSPEQVQGERVDHRTDLFAAGAVLYEMLTQHRAFGGDSLATTVYKIVHQAPEPMDRFRPGLPQGFVAIVARALAKDPSERYQSAGDLQADLLACRGPSLAVSRTAAVPEAIPAAAPAGASPSPPSARSVVWSPRRVRTTAIVGVLLTAGFVGTWIGGPGRPDTQPPQGASPAQTPPPAAAPTAAGVPTATATTDAVTEASGATSQPPRAAETATAAPPPAPATLTREERRAIAAAIARVDEARAAAEALDASRLSAGTYRAALSLEAEGRALAASPPVTDALTRLAEAAARFRGAAIEAEVAGRARAAEAAAAQTPPQTRVAEPPPVEQSRPEPRATAPPASAPAVPPAASVTPPAAATPVTSPPAPASTAASKPAPGPPPSPNAEQQVRDVIAQYVAGLEGRNMSLLKRVWPSLGGAQERAIQNEFANSRVVQVRFSESKVDVSGDSATMTGIRDYSLVTEDGQRLSTVTRTTISLRRSGDAWHIERVIHQPR
jgi:serine/threonine-protein kinase